MDIVSKWERCVGIKLFDDASLELKELVDDDRVVEVMTKVWWVYWTSLSLMMERKIICWIFEVSTKKNLMNFALITSERTKIYGTIPWMKSEWERERDRLENLLNALFSVFFALCRSCLFLLLILLNIKI